MTCLSRRELVLAAGALALGASEAAALPARDAPWTTPAARRAGGAKPRALRELARRVRGPVLRPGDGRYAAAARVYNARFDGARPDAVIEPRDSRDVQAILRWADRHDVRVTARSGGHSYAGYSTLGEGVVVDLRRLDGIAVRRGDARVSVGAGAHAIAIVDALARHGGAVPLGSCPTVGLGGLALGGGYGLAARAWGLTADNVTAITVVTPDGRLRRVDRRHDEDLFWALRGAGGGNFGDRHALRAARAPRGPGRVVPRHAAGGDAAIAAWQAWAPETDPQLTVAPAAGEQRERGRARPVPRPEAELDRLLAPLRRAGASLTTGTAAYGPLQVRWANGRTSPAHRRFSAKSHYVTPRRCPPARAPALVAELAASTEQPAARRLRRRAQPPPRPRHRLRPPRRALLDPVPRLPLRRRRGEPRLAAAHAPHGRAARVRRVPELPRSRARRLAPRLLRPQPRAPRASATPDRRFRFRNAI